MAVNMTLFGPLEMSTFCSQIVCNLIKGFTIMCNGEMSRKASTLDFITVAFRQTHLYFSTDVVASNQKDSLNCQESWM